MKCIQCGREFKPKHKLAQLCSDKCKAERVKIKQQEWLEKKRAEHKEEEDTSQEANSTSCHRAAICVYGGTVGTMIICDYLCKTGKSRSGYPSECTHYRKRKRKLRGIPT